MMWQSTLTRIDPVTRSSSAALLCSVLVKHLSSMRSELLSEILAWAIVPIICKVARQRYGGTIPIAASPTNALPSGASLWVLAVNIAVSCLYKAEINVVGFLPASTPLLLVVDKYLVPRPRSSPQPKDSWFFAPFAHTIWSASLAALFAIMATGDWDLRGYALSLIHIASWVVFYLTLTLRHNKSSRLLSNTDFGDEIFILSCRVVAVLFTLLYLETVVFHFPWSPLWDTLTLAVVKALYWHFIIQTAQQSSWRIATVVETFSIMSTHDLFAPSSLFQTLSHILASVLSFGQLIHTLPTRANAKSMLWAFVPLVSLAPYLVQNMRIQMAQSSWIMQPNQHPVQILIRNAETDFQNMLAKQSQNLQAAETEYRRRYDMDPPPGFEAWFEFAQSRHSSIIDEFDMIHQAVSPFWILSGKEVLEIMGHAASKSNSELWYCEFVDRDQFTGQEAKTHCRHPYRTFDRHNTMLFDRLLGNLSGGGELQNVKFLINHFDEPRVMIPPGLPSDRREPLNLTDLSRKPVWDTLTQFCSSQERTSTATSLVVETFGLPFVTNPSSLDLCQHPEYRNMHGLLMSPTSFHLIQGLVPVLSTGTPSTMGDILYPSPAYIESNFEYDESQDMDWSQKRNNLYWAGSNTGGFSSSKWQHYHRQRFVQLTQNLHPQPSYSYLRSFNGIIGRVTSSFLNTHLYDVAFTRIFQCLPTQCRDQRTFFHLRPWANKDLALSSRLVFDMDGNGISGRYYKLLASKSTPLKQTLLREWHDERLVPWVHYVPVSLGMEELPELVSYLTTTEEGREAARRIAEGGRRWFGRALREVDRAVYVYRLLLELARLQDPGRLANGTLDNAA